MTLMKMRSFCDGLGQEKYVVGQILNLVFFYHFSRQMALLFPLKKPTFTVFNWLF